MLMLKPSVLKMDIISFLQRSVVLPFAFLKITNPSSRYNPLSFLLTLSCSSDSVYNPTSSHISAPSEDPIVTSKQLVVFFFFLHGSLLRNKNDFLQCLIGRMSFSVMSTYCFANSNDFPRTRYIYKVYVYTHI